MELYAGKGGKSKEEHRNEKNDSGDSEVDN